MKMEDASRLLVINLSSLEEARGYGHRMADAAHPHPHHRSGTYMLDDAACKLSEGP